MNQQIKDHLITSDLEMETSKQPKKLLKDAEALLMSEMPIGPIFFYSLNCLQGPGFEGVTVTPLGIQLFRDTR